MAEKQQVSDSLKTITATLYDVVSYANLAAEDNQRMQEQLSDSVSKIHIDIATLRQSINTLTTQVTVLVTELQNDKASVTERLKSVTVQRDLKCNWHSEEIKQMKADIDESYTDRKELRKDVNTLRTNFKSLLVGIVVLQFALQLGMQLWLHHSDADAKQAQKTEQTSQYNLGNKQ